MSTASVPFLDLALQHGKIDAEVRAGIDVLFARSSYILGPEVTTFESQFADYCAVPHCIGVGNGTDALELALRAAGVQPGSDVVIPVNTFVATAEAVVRVGANVVLADCDDNFLLDPEQLAASMTARTSAVIPVHLYGQMAPMAAIDDVVDGRVPVIEDAAQSQGATQGGRRAGSFGVAAATSFYPGKNLGAYGDAGAVLTSSAEVDVAVRALRNHGGIVKYEHELMGTNSRLDSIQALVLSAKLAQLDGWNAERVAAAKLYEELLADVDGVTTPRTVDGNGHVWHLYVVRVQNRDEVVARMVELGIGVGIHYPAPIHQLPAFASLNYSVGDFPVAEQQSAEIFSLPIFPGITADQQARVVHALRHSLG